MSGRLVVLAFFGVAGGLTVGGEAARDLGRGLVAYYSFDKDASDGSGKGHDGTNHGAKAVAEGRFGGAFEFDGKSSYVAVPAKVTEGLLWATFALWVRTTQAEGKPRSQFYANPALFGVATNGWGSRDFALMLEKGCPGYFHGLFAESVDYSWFSAQSVSDDKWHHLAWVDEGPYVRVYLDGRLLRGETTLHSGNGSVEIGVLGHTPAGLRLGSVGIFLGGSNFAFERGAPASFFRGRLDDVGIWARALSAEEVAALAAGGAVGSVVLGERGRK